jgi:hypothetical protein
MRKESQCSRLLWKLLRVLLRVRILKARCALSIDLSSKAKIHLKTLKTILSVKSNKISNSPNLQANLNSIKSNLPKILLNIDNSGNNTWLQPIQDHLCLSLKILKERKERRKKGKQKNLKDKRKRKRLRN